ncbi:MAG: hypothetical protein GYB64_06550 [Chloroflexi bacterium]|nr:hypothetical protein [Chloroflexota bacterium]
MDVDAPQQSEDLFEDPRPSGPILAVDVGTVNTRALLIDSADGMYRFFAWGEAPSTAQAPWSNIIQGVAWAVEQITRTTGRALMDERFNIVMPERTPYLGVDQVVATASGGQPIRAVLIGLMPEFSIASSRRASESAYFQIVDSYSLVDGVAPETILNRLLKDPPDVIILSGGTDGGTVEALRRRIDLVTLACASTDRSRRPSILYAGNAELADEVADLFQEIGINHLIAPNPNPILGVEQLDELRAEIVKLYRAQKSRSTSGFDEINDWSELGIVPTAQGFGQLIAILGVLEGENILGIDVGSSATTVAASIDGESYLSVYGDLGVGHAARSSLDSVRVEAVARWMVDASPEPDDVRDAIWNKWLFPHTLPATPEARDLEYGFAREVVRTALRRLRDRLGQPLPAFQQILLSGATLTRAPHPGIGVMSLLDGLLPTNSPRILSDAYGIAPMLGVMSIANPRAVVQVLDTGAFLEMARVLVAEGRARPGDIVARGTLTRPSTGDVIEFEAPYGTFTVVPLPQGDVAELALEAKGVTFDLPGGRRGYTTQVYGSQVGVVIDARGRPYRMPRDAGARRTLIERWQTDITRREFS